MVVLFVIAHPDDECMFFYPSIAELRKNGHEIHLLCLSKGNCYGLGDVRTCELYHSCSLLGIRQRNVTVVDDPGMQDGMEHHWDTRTVAEYVVKIATHIGAHMLVTFDHYGVSGHINHRSVYAGVLVAGQIMCSAEYGGGNTALYTLKSSNILVKYSGILSLLIEPLFHVLEGAVTSRSPSIRFWNTDIVSVWRAMLCHESQMTWYRRLFILCSQYSFTNRLIEVQAG